MKRRHILFLILPIFATILSAIALNNFISSYIIKQTKEKIQNVLLSNRGFHRYIQEVLHPAFFEAVKNGYISYDYYNPEFLSSSFIIRTMHGLYNQEREKNRLVKIYYKMAANNPRNPVNKADEEEARLIKLFNENSSIKEYEQVVSVKGKKYLYYAIPFLRNDHRCLKCHGDPSTAPVGLMQRYPLEGGFYERLGEIRAIESIRIPVDEEEYTAMKITIPLSAGFLTVLLLFFFNTGLRQQVRNKTKNLEEEIAVRIKAENALKEALKKAEDEQEKTKAILAGIGEGISIQDRDFKIIYQNDIQKEMMGNQEGKYCYRAYENKEAVCENCQLALSFKDGLIHHAERTVESPEGKRYFDITSSPIKDSSGEIVAGVESVRDVTERRLARVELEAEKERLAVTLRSIGDGVIVTDTSGMITLINKSAEHLTGWKDEDARGRELSEIFNIINEETRQRCENPADNVLRNGAIVSLQSNTILIRKDGSEIVIADSAAPIMDYMSKTIGVVLVFRDVTTQQQLEKEMRKIQKLESLGVLAGGLAHDFNNLLTSIMGNISLAKMYAGSDNKAFNRLIEAEKAAQRAADLTKQMLTFSKGGAPIKKPALISDIVKEAVGFALSGANIVLPQMEMDFHAA